MLKDIDPLLNADLLDTSRRWVMGTCWRSSIGTIQRHRRPNRLVCLSGVRMNDAEQRAVAIAHVERFEFYRRAADAYLVVATTEDRPYGCFLVTKGVV